MPLFEKKDPAEEEFARARQQALGDSAQAAEAAQAARAVQAFQAMLTWVCSVPPGDLAAHLMAAFGPDGSAFWGCNFTSRWPGLTEDSLVDWLFRGCPKPIRAHKVQMHGPVLEALQVLEHAELVFLSYVSDGDYREWSPTRLGLATLTNGKEAVRQRIKDRTGL
jgi:hypothetical protein